MVILEKPYVSDLLLETVLPLHIEVRVGKTGDIFPIEFNPMRFAGWCTTDLAYYAYGINVYEYFWRQWEPDWQRSLKDKEGKVFSIVVGDVPADRGQVRRVDYERFTASFSRPLAIRKMDYCKYGLFAFAFIETDGNERSELDWILQADYREFLVF